MDALEPHAAALPVLEGEVGDTWIHGVASDPAKSQRFRAIQRMRSRCLLEESCTAQDPAFRNFTRLLLKARLRRGRAARVGGCCVPRA